MLHLLKQNVTIYPIHSSSSSTQSMNIVNKKGLKDNAYNFTAELCLSDLIRCKLSETPEQISNNLSMLTAFPILQQQPAAAAADIGQSKARQKLRELLTSCSGYFIYTHTHKVSLAVCEHNDMCCNRIIKAITFPIINMVFPFFIHSHSHTHKHTHTHVKLGERYTIFPIIFQL